MPQHFTILSDDVSVASVRLATQEQRSISRMLAVLVREALVARGVLTVPTDASAPADAASDADPDAAESS